MANIPLSKLNIPLIFKLDLPNQVKNLINDLSKADFEIYLIGGFVRDLILKKISFDLDFLIIGRNPREICNELAKRFDGHSFLLDEDTMTTRLILRGSETALYTFDFTSVQKKDLEKDFQRRDFTINALAINLNNPDELIDKFSGLSDLQNKVIRAIATDNFLDDPLRFLRAFRFAALLGGEIEKESLEFIKNNLKSFDDKISKERVSFELWKILDLDNSFTYIKQIGDIGLLEKMLPELTPTRKVTPNSHHHLWLFDHSIELIKTFEENFYKIPPYAKEILSSPFGETLSPLKKAVTKLACLLHDIGKPSTWEIKEIDGNEKHTFCGHDKIGAEIVKGLGERLKLSNAIINCLTKLVRYHLRPFQLSNPNEPITEKALYRFFRDIGNDTPSLLMLALADLHATLGPKITKDDVKKSEELVLYLFDAYAKYAEKKLEQSKKPKLLDGNEIMKITGLKPSPELGKIIKELDEAIGVGDIKTKEEAIKFVKEHLN